jgi:hypothetical protein
VEPQDGKSVAPCGSVMSLLLACALVGLALAPVAGAFAWYGSTHSGMWGVAAALLAAAVCWISASLALVAVFVGQRLDAGIQGILAGMFFRMGLPLAAAMALKQNSPRLSEAGIFYMILGLYLVALVVETLLSLRFVPPNAGKAAPGSIDQVAGHVQSAPQSPQHAQ